MSRGIALLGIALNLALSGCVSVPRTPFDVPLDPETRVNAWPAYVGDDKTGYILWPLIKVAEGEKRFYPFYSYDHGVHDIAVLMMFAPKYHASEVWPIWSQKDDNWLLFPLAFSFKSSNLQITGAPTIPFLFSYTHSLEEDPAERDWSWRVLTGGRFDQWGRSGSYLFPLWYHSSVEPSMEEERLGENFWWSLGHFSSFEGVGDEGWHNWGVGPLGIPIVHGRSERLGLDSDFEYQAVYPFWVRKWYPHTEAYAWGTPLFGASKDPVAEEGWWYALTCGSAWDPDGRLSWAMPFYIRGAETNGESAWWWSPVAYYGRTPRHREVYVGPLSIPWIYSHISYYPTFNEKGEQDSLSGYDFSVLFDLLGATKEEKPDYKKTRQSFAFFFHNERKKEKDGDSHEVKTLLVDYKHKTFQWAERDDESVVHHEETYGFNLVKGLLWDGQRTLRDGALLDKDYGMLWGILFARHYYDAPVRIASMPKTEEAAMNFSSYFGFLLWSFATDTTRFAWYNDETSAIVQKERDTDYGLYGLLYNFEYEKKTEQKAGEMPETTAFTHDNRVLLGLLYRRTMEENGSYAQRSLGGALFNNAYNAEKGERLFSILGYLYRRESTPRIIRTSVFPGIQKTSNVNDEGWSFSIFHKVFRIERTTEDDLKWWLFGL